MDSDAPSPEKPRKRRWLRRVLVAALVLVAVGVLLHILWSMHTRHGLEAEIARLRAAGDPVTLEELWPPEIEPESENAALLYQQADNLFGKNGYGALEGSVGADVSWDDPGSWSEETLAAVRQTLAQCDEALALVRRAAHMDRCRFDPKWGWPATTPIYHYAMLRQVARALCWSAALKLHDGDADGALQEAHAAFLASRALATEPTLIGLLVQLAIIQTGLGEAQSVLEENAPRTELLRSFLADVEQTRAALRQHLVDAFKGERVEALANLAPISRLDYLLPAASRRAAPPPPRASLAWLGRPVIGGMVMGYLDTVTRAIEFGRANWVEAQPPMDALQSDAARWRTHYLSNRSRVLAALAVPAWVIAKKAETRAEAALAVAEVAMALKLYKSEHGEYPESLDALSGAFLPVVPTDPFTNKPLVYVRRDDGFLVYSVGPNGKDDAGVSETWKDGQKLDAGTDDVAWRCSQ